MASSSDEDDYMSDAFLVDTKETKPGLRARTLPPSVIKKYEKEKRIKELNQKHRAENKPIQVKEKESRDKKLNESLDQSNKGFALLAKMGFKEGMGLGKHGTGRAEPIPLNIKTDRGGLGQAEMLKRKQETLQAAREESLKRRKLMEERMSGDYRARQKESFAEKKIIADLNKSQRACEQLDSAKNIECQHWWYWPNYPHNETDEYDEEEEAQEQEEYEEEEEEPEDWEKLQILTHYLRSAHLYCIWCGTTYNDEDDLNYNCPGDTSDAHNE